MELNKEYSDVNSTFQGMMYQNLVQLV